MKIKCQVSKCEPGEEAGARYDAYELEADPTDSVLDVLIKIYHQHDPALSFRYACSGYIKCGECAVQVNGDPCLACEKLVEPEMKIEPLPNLPLIKDLVVDRRAVLDRILARLPQRPDPQVIAARVAALKPESIERYVVLTKCYECLICEASCPETAEPDSDFIGPLGMLWLAQSSLFPGNARRDDITSALELCTQCRACAAACPCPENILDLALETL